MNENVWNSITISLKCVPECPINNIPTLVQIMAWRRPGDKALTDQLGLAYWRIYTSLGLSELIKHFKYFLFAYFSSVLTDNANRMILYYVWPSRQYHQIFYFRFMSEISIISVCILPSMLCNACLGAQHLSIEWHFAYLVYFSYRFHILFCKLVFLLTLFMWAFVYNISFL